MTILIILVILAIATIGAIVFVSMKQAREKRDRLVRQQSRALFNRADRLESYIDRIPHKYMPKAVKKIIVEQVGHCYQQIQQLAPDAPRIDKLVQDNIQRLQNIDQGKDPPSAAIIKSEGDVTAGQRRLNDVALLLVNWQKKGLVEKSMANHAINALNGSHSLINADYHEKIAENAASASNYSKAKFHYSYALKSLKKVNDKALTERTQQVNAKYQALVEKEEAEVEAKRKEKAREEAEREWLSTTEIADEDLENLEDWQKKKF